MARREQTHLPAVRSASEKNLGITQRCTPINFAWTGDIRKRYTDFLVYEIRKDGSVIHLREFEVDEEQEKIARQFMESNAQNGRNFSTTHNGSRNFTNYQGARNFTSAGGPQGREGSNPSAAVENAVPPKKTISDSDKQALIKLVGDTLADELVQFDEKVQAKTPTGQDVTFKAVSDRAQRAVIHQEIRRIFDGRLETVADSNGVITAMATKPSGRNGGNRNPNQNQGFRGQPGPRIKSFAQLGGDYIHLTLYKENKDTMDAINTVARLLKIKATNFGFAGTKDRRAATVQRISIFRQREHNLIWLNSRLPNVKVGDFVHSKTPLQLGQHGGNEFVITLKNCEPLGMGADVTSLEHRMKTIQSAVEAGLAYLKHHGYINYYGLQRFGTYSIGTHLLGMKILNGDFESVLEDILHVDEQYFQDVLDKKVPQGHGVTGDTNRDDYNRAKAITTWKATKNADKALEVLPKRFSSESSIIQHLNKNPKDHMGALLSITRGMRTMYIHAYQSYVWNHVASHRWAKYGATVVEGDLVVVDTSKVSADSAGFEPAEDDDDTNFFTQARPLTAEDVASGKFTISDVVLPTPGFDVIYPQNDIGQYYVSFMAKKENGELDPYNMRRRHKEFSLSGNYRHLIGRFIVEPEYAIRLYHDDTQQLYPTDLDFANHTRALKKAKTLKARELSPEAAATAAHWAQFNDEATPNIGEDRRRKASASPVPETITTKETWVQTGVDSNAKRVKLARHHDTVSAKNERTVLLTITEGTEAALNPTPAARAPNAEVNATADNSAEDVKMEDVGPTVNASANASSGQSGASRDGSTSSTKKSYGSLGPAAPTQSAMAIPSVVMSTVVDQKLDNETITSGVTRIGKVILPEFCKPSDNPIVSVNDFSQELVRYPNAKKIAVILKFQLKSSNYATVVLRELMGTTLEENA
ncbi:hypothetical protein OQA88_10416 [Cercophora sp. LCS_1]